MLDLFAGGCSVSYALKAGGYRVISNDILYADYVIARALVENQDQRLEEDIFTRQVSDARVAELWAYFAFLEERLYYPAEVRELARPVQEIVRQRADPFPDRPVAALRLPFPAVFPQPPQEIVARRKRKILREMRRLPFPLAARPVLPPPGSVAFPEFQQFYSMTTAV